MGELREIRESLALVAEPGAVLANNVGLFVSDATVGAHLGVAVDKVLNFLVDLGLGSTFEGILDELAGIHDVLLLSGDPVAAQVDTLAGAVGGIRGCNVELESFFLGLTSELDALSPEEVSLLGFFAFAATPSPHLAVKPAVARIVSGEAADVAVEVLERVQNRADALHLPVFLVVSTGEELSGFDGLAFLTLNDLVEGEDRGLDVRSFVFEHFDMLCADLFCLEVFGHPLHAKHEVDKLLKVEVFDWV